MSRHSLFSKMDSEELVGNAEGQCGPIGVSGCTTPSHLTVASSLRERKQQLCKILLVSDSLQILADPGVEKRK